MKLLFLDTETLGLDPIIHAVWEVAAVLAEHTEDGHLVEIANYETCIMVTAAQRDVATPIALEIGHFWDRYYEKGAVRPGEAVAHIDALCNDKPNMVGAVPSFDDRRFGDLMRKCGVEPRWHYHLMDIEAMADGYLSNDGDTGSGAFCPPRKWKSDDLSRSLGVNPEDFARHTAMGDVRWCMAQYASIKGLTQCNWDDVDEGIPATPVDTEVASPNLPVVVETTEPTKITLGISMVMADRSRFVLNDVDHVYHRDGGPLVPLKDWTCDYTSAGRVLWIYDDSGWRSYKDASIMEDGRRDTP